MKKATLTKNSKLSNYTAVAGAVLATGAVNGQIVYQDVNPDVIVTKATAPYQLDLNSDANPDLVFGVVDFQGSGTTSYPGLGTFTFTYAGSYAAVQPGVGAAVLGAVGGSYSTFLVSALDNGNAIGAAANFGTDQAELATVGAFNVPAFAFTYPFESGEWVGATDKFLGVRFTNAGNMHYGWVRMDVAADASSITIKDYAYNSQMGSAINAGQTLNLGNIAVDNKVTIRPMLDKAIVNVTPDLVGGTVSIVDITGKEVKSVLITDIDTTIEFNGIDTGIYHITAQFEAGKVNKKVYIK